MNPLDIVLIVFVVLVVICLIVLAASEPKYTWRDFMTLEERMAELGRAMDELRIAIGNKLVPAFEQASESILKFAKAASRFRLE